MLRSGADARIINMSSQMGHIGAAQRTVYCMTKHAIEGLTKAMAVELAPAGIWVNAVAPTFIETPLTHLESPVSLQPPAGRLDRRTATIHHPSRHGGV